MKLFGSIKELVKVVFRQNGQEIELDSNQATTYTGTRLHQLPPGDASQILVSESATQTLTNKTIDADDNTISDIADANIKAGAAISATKIADGSVDNTEFQKLGTAGTAGAGNLVTTDGTQTLTGKTVDGDDNTIQDLAITSIKTVLADANKVLRRDASGVPQSGNTIPNASDLVTTDASQTLTAKTIDGDDNTVQDLALTSLKTALADADKVIRRDASGIVVSGNNLPNSSAIVTTDATQTLTNKTLQNDLVDNYLDFNEEAAPATPASGSVRVYAKTDGRLYSKDDAGTEQGPFGAGGGSAESVYTVTNADYAITDSDGYTTILVSTGASDRTITLPTVADNSNRQIKIKKIDSGAGKVIIDGENTESIDGAATYTMYVQYDEITVQANNPGTAWFIINKNLVINGQVRADSWQGGSGSTNTRILRITNSTVTGSSITFDGNSATLGCSITINQPGIYTFMAHGYSTAATLDLGFSLNSTQLSTNIASINNADILAIGFTNTNTLSTVTCTVRLAAGDVVRPHANTSANVNTNAAYGRLIATQVARF